MARVTPLGTSSPDQIYECLGTAIARSSLQRQWPSVEGHVLDLCGRFRSQSVNDARATSTHVLPVVRGALLELEDHLATVEPKVFKWYQYWAKRRYRLHERHALYARAMMRALVDALYELSSEPPHLPEQHPGTTILAEIEQSRLNIPILKPARLPWWKRLANACCAWIGWRPFQVHGLAYARWCQLDEQLVSGHLQLRRDVRSFLKNFSKVRSTIKLSLGWRDEDALRPYHLEPIWRDFTAFVEQWPKPGDPKHAFAHWLRQDPCSQGLAWSPAEARDALQTRCDALERFMHNAGRLQGQVPDIPTLFHDQLKAQREQLETLASSCSEDFHPNLLEQAVERLQRQIEQYLQQCAEPTCQEEAAEMVSTMAEFRLEWEQLHVWLSTRDEKGQALVQAGFIQKNAACLQPISNECKTAVCQVIPDHLDPAKTAQRVWPLAWLIRREADIKHGASVLERHDVAERFKPDKEERQRWTEILRQCQRWLVRLKTPSDELMGWEDFVKALDDVKASMALRVENVLEQSNQKLLRSLSDGSLASSTSTVITSWSRSTKNSKPQDLPAVFESDEAVLESGKDAAWFNR